MYANEPSSPCSSPVNSTERIVRRGLIPERTIASADARTLAEPVPLSVVPSERSHESRCAPTTSTCSGFSRPRISPTTLAVSTGPFVNVFCTLHRTRTFFPLSAYLQLPLIFRGHRQHRNCKIGVEPENPGVREVHSGGLR